MSRYLAFRRIASVVTCAAAALHVGCASSSTPPSFEGALPLGNWGSDSAGMIVSDTAMHLHIRCTYGDASGRIPVDANGRFDVSGSYMLRAYPIAVGPTLPARFSGRLTGSSATMTVTVNDTVEHQTVVLGPVMVTYGEEPRPWPCPICRRPIVTRRQQP